ncbi:MAG: hypothetical protein JXR53_11300 [Bacteroidales bacterium]|nr:hypothetical protein [Bacteroidales bacterium]
MDKNNYIKTLEMCEELKTKLDELSELLNFSVNQGIANKFNDKKEDLKNWIEEIEFTINDYEQN